MTPNCVVSVELDRCGEQGARRADTEGERSTYFLGAGQALQVVLFVQFALRVFDSLCLRKAVAVLSPEEVAAVPRPVQGPAVHWRRRI